MVPSSMLNHATLYAQTNATLIFHNILPLISVEENNNTLMAPPTPSPKKSPLQDRLPTSEPVKLQPPHPLEQHVSHSHIVGLVMTVMACMVGVVMFLFTVSLLIRYFYLRRISYSRNRNTTRDTPILFHVNGGSPTSDNDDDDVDQEELAVAHPIWYIRTVGLQQSLIDSITVFKYKKDDGIIDGTECSVCLGEFEHDESLRLLPKCSHAFHIPCIDTWLRSHKNCPICRAPVLRDGLQIRSVDQNNNSNQTEINVSDHDHQSQNQVAHVENSDRESGEDDGVSVEEGRQGLRRSVSGSMIGDVVVDLESENYNCEKVNNKGVMSIGKNGSSSSTSVCKDLQKRTVSMRRSFSHNRMFLFSRHCRSQSSTLPL